MNALPSTNEAAALLADRFEDAEPLDLVALARSSPALVVAPHPDDESLGCGGLLARLGDAGVDVRAILVTDGAASHPRSTRYDAAARRALRDREWLRALACLGLRDGAANRLGWTAPSRSPAIHASRRCGPISRSCSKQSRRNSSSCPGGATRIPTIGPATRSFAPRSPKERSGRAA